MEKLLYIIRHGQTDLNLKGIVQGRGINSPLNEMGRKQAEAFYAHYRDERFDKIYTSTLLRTHQTVAPFMQDGIPMEQLEGLDEIGWGIYEGKEQTPEIMEGFADLIMRWRNGELDAAVAGGESPNQLAARQRKALDRILSVREEEKVLVCMHGRAMRVLLCLLINRDIAQMDDFPHTNTALYKVLYDGRGFSIADAYNIQHLEGLLTE
ncbi:histidine phosphatase family protein [Parapedobacter sp. ISTM3]|uniref:Probable phosphoglycerate mutase n=1 Tax=Parapedobacter luteus TaxID=623280 RepID=A0A1T5EZI7_9SPHI|nr:MULTISPECIES: histidine phosphatase family protein [Parapedobacter]MBK1439321.1 histidine phosphatase family protein [Parapedobacter sp. ISTM3]SKB89337.1 probable phosphoglycerate mutase [Parapedobacter luteus]